MRCCEIAAIVSPRPSTEAELIGMASGLYQWVAWQPLPGVPDKPTAAKEAANR